MRWLIHGSSLKRGSSSQDGVRFCCLPVARAPGLCCRAVSNPALGQPTRHHRSGRATGRCRHRNEHAGIEVVASKPLHVSPVGLQFGGFEPGDSLPVPVGPASSQRPSLATLPVLAVRGGEDHGVVGPELREPVVAPISGTTSLHDTHHAERPQVDPAEFAGQGGAPFNWSPAATPGDQHRSSCCGRIGDKVETMIRKTRELDRGSRGVLHRSRAGARMARRDQRAVALRADRKSAERRLRAAPGRLRSFCACAGSGAGIRCGVAG